MVSFFADAPLPVRADIEASHRLAWENLGRPGAYWTGAERVAIIAEMRAALRCPFCARRKQALSPNMVEGEHETTGNTLSAPAIDAVHRIITDPGRLTEAWLKKLLSQGLDEGAYVELTGVIIQAIVIDTFDRALGLPARVLPPIHAGEPSGIVPEGLTYEGAWVKTVPTKIGIRNFGREEIYFKSSFPIEEMLGEEFVGFVNRALSHAPEEIRNYGKLVHTDYIPFPDVGNIPEYAKHGRAISPTQIELISSRISTLNGCFY